MKLKLEEIESFPLQEFRQLGILCCRRLAYLIHDKRLTKALRKLEQSQEPPTNEQMLRDAYNAANSAFLEIRRQHHEMTIEAAAACTLVCACAPSANLIVLGNFEYALSMAESLTLSEVRSIEDEMLKQIESSGS